jgi:hypothetical protein
MAIQEFDRPLRHMERQSRWSWQFCLSVTLLIAAVGFISYSIMSLPGPKGHEPHAYRQLSEVPRH